MVKGYRVGQDLNINQPQVPISIYLLLFTLISYYRDAMAKYMKVVTFGAVRLDKWKVKTSIPRQVEVTRLYIQEQGMISFTEMPPPPPLPNLRFQV